jgi:hypothetical protein
MECEVMSKELFKGGKRTDLPILHLMDRRDITKKDLAKFPECHINDTQKYDVFLSSKCNQLLKRLY